MRIVTGLALALALATLFAATRAEAAITKRQAASRIKAAVLKSARAAPTAGRFSARLGKLVKGTKYVYPFTASYLRRVVVRPFGSRGARVMYRNATAEGTINLQTEKVIVKRTGNASAVPAPGGVHI